MKRIFYYVDESKLNKHQVENLKQYALKLDLFIKEKENELKGLINELSEVKELIKKKK